MDERTVRPEVAASAEGGGEPSLAVVALAAERLFRHLREGDLPDTLRALVLDLARRHGVPAVDLEAAPFGIADLQRLLREDGRTPPPVLRGLPPEVAARVGRHLEAFRREGRDVAAREAEAERVVRRIVEGDETLLHRILEQRYGPPDPRTSTLEPTDYVDELERMRAEVVRNRRLLDDIQMELTQVPFVDPVTGVWNRLQVVERLAGEWNRCARRKAGITALLVAVGGRDGPRALRRWGDDRLADVLLREVARRVKGQLRSYDLVGRHDGTTFLVIAPECDARGARRLAGRILDAITRRPVEVNGRLLEPAVRMGGSTVVAGDETLPEDLLDAVARALETARSGEERVVMARGTSP